MYVYMYVYNMYMHDVFIYKMYAGMHVYVYEHTMVF